MLGEWVDQEQVAGTKGLDLGVIPHPKSRWRWSDFAGEASRQEIHRGACVKLKSHFSVAYQHGALDISTGCFLDSVNPFSRFGEFFLVLYLVYSPTWRRAFGGEVVSFSTVTTGLAIGRAFFFPQSMEVRAKLAGLVSGLRRGVSKRRSSIGRIC